MENSVEAAMSSNIQTISISDTAEQAAKKMRDMKIGSLFVVDKSKSEQQPVGIITERDLVRRVCAEGISSRDIGIERLISSPIATIERKATIASAASLMSSNKTRHLLVVNNGEEKLPVGVISSTDLAKYLKANMDVNEVNARILEALMEDEELSQS
jgi:CBS domain-containing protein